jgi:hypothetical protein
MFSYLHCRTHLGIRLSELTERRIAKKGRELPDDFWEEGD